MNLAKHEVPKMKGVPSLAPGYRRIDMMSGSMVWQVDLGNMTVDMVSRRSLADQLREIVIGYQPRGYVLQGRERGSRKKKQRKLPLTRGKKRKSWPRKDYAKRKNDTDTNGHVPCSRAPRGQVTWIFDVSTSPCSSFFAGCPTAVARFVAPIVIQFCPMFGTYVRMIGDGHLNWRVRLSPVPPKTTPKTGLLA